MAKESDSFKVNNNTPPTCQHISVPKSLNSCVDICYQ
uniref:Uncharacterized protein n=1 Tax=Anguilla anguilla TaxID=7936 RepID=A0A0E9RSJ2_ANGAN